jgi:hypothetical protein
MNWLNKLLGIGGEKDGNKANSSKTTTDGGKSALDPYEGLDKNIKFGRYSDNNKTLQKTKQWYAAEDYYKEKKYAESFDALFDYLRDENEDNVHYTKDDKGFSFELVQGSKKIYGDSDGKFISALVPLAVMENPSTAAMRRLLELNYGLYYTRCAVDDDNILYMVFDSEIHTSSPNKLYYGLRELSIKADRHDDLLLADFSSLKAADSDHIIPLGEHELEVKYKYFRKWIEETLVKVEALNKDSFSGAIAYLLLGVVYRIDFLITPESSLLSKLEKINNIYWEKKEEITLIERNKLMKDELAKLLDISKEEFAKNIFHSKGTFSMSSPAKVDKVRDHITNANRDSNWYVENKYPEIALLINEYGVLYNQFIYSMPKVQTDIITVYMAALHADFFEELGLKEPFYYRDKKEFNKTKIVIAIDKAIAAFKDKYTGLKFDHSRVSFTSMYDFGITISERLINLNLETKRV